MRWERTGRRSANLEDRRGRGGGGGLGGGGMRIPMGRGGKIGIPSVVGLLLALFFGTDVFGGGGQAFPVDVGLSGFPQVEPGQGGPPPPESDPDAETVDFVSFLLDDQQATWQEVFSGARRTYRPADLVLYEGGTETACGFGRAATGPFYCPADQKVYVDLSFFDELSRRFGAPGDFAIAYVLAHEIGHHVQQLTGISDEVRRLQRQQPDSENELSVRLELQADCFAGVWGYGTAERGLMEPGDLEEGLGAAAAVGDDRIQSSAGVAVSPETWTHGSSEQRQTWFRRGYDSGDMAACDTFAS